MTVTTESVRAHQHAVQFYEDDQFLVQRVADFLAQGIDSGEPCIVIATAQHNAAFAERLRFLGSDPERVTFLDARDTLEQFLDRGTPDAQRFGRVVGGVIRDAGGQSRRVRAYGEMVDLLWRDGEPDAALRLEQLWNDLAGRYTFSLLCAYAMGNFYKEADGAYFEAICDAHDGVRPTESVLHEDRETRERKIALLQRRAAALEMEIAHRKQLEARLSEALAARRRSEELLRDFIDNAAMGLHWVGPDGTIEWANDAELKLLGYSRDEYVGRNIADFHADAQAIDDILCRLGRSEEINGYEARLVARDGTIKWVSISSNALFENGRFVHTRCFTQDITSRKRLEEQNAYLLEVTSVLSRSLDYRTRLEDLARIIVPRLADWCAIDVARDGGYDRLVVVRGDDDEPALAFDEQRPAAAAGDPVLQVIASREPLLVSDANDELVAHVAGSDADATDLRGLDLRSLIVAPMVADGRVVGAISLARSETRGRYADADLLLAVDLASRAGAFIELARLYHVAEINNRSKDEFLATLSHELRTPLTAILGWSKMLAMGLDDETFRTAVMTIEQSARTQASLVDDLLDVSRVVSGKLSLQHQPVDLSEVVADVLRAMKVAADGKRMRVEASGLDERAVVQGDATRLQQIVWNLVSNAIKFSPEESTVSVRLEHRGGQARIVVADDGRGIAPAFLPLVFDPFRQADATATRAQGGLGLGLAIVKYLVEAHGGTVTAESGGLGRGATFTVTLPLVPRVAAIAADTRPWADLRGTTVLVVDDDASSRHMLKAALSRCGAEVETAESVAGARASLARRAPHFIITDVAMPGEDGIALAREVRANDEIGAIRVFALTAFHQHEDSQREFDAFLRKPIDPMEVARRIAHVRDASPSAT